MKFKYAVHIDAVFRRGDPVEALKGVKEAGFKYYEFSRTAGKDLDALKKTSDSLGLSCVCLSGKGRPVNLTDPNSHDEWIEVLKESINNAKILGPGCLVATAGDDTGARRDFQRRSIVNAFKKAIPIATENNITLVLEPLNGRVNHKGTFLESSEEAFDILDEINDPHVKLLFDIYHQQITEGDVIRRMVSGVKHIGHIHTAGSKGRNELNLGELNYPYVLESLVDAGYDGYIGFEYSPSGDSLEGLKRMFDYLPK